MYYQHSYIFFFWSEQQGGKKAAALADFEKAVAAVETNTDNSNFISYEKEFIYLQGQMFSGNACPNKLTVSDFTQVPIKREILK